MSVVVPSERDEWWVPDDPCLLCSQPIPANEPAVLWSGAQQVILHGECAKQLGLHLICDAREVELAGGGHWWKRAPRALRSALTVQEGRRT